MTWINPLVLILLILVPLAILFLRRRAEARTEALRRLGNEELIQQLSTQISPLRRQIKSLLWLLALTSLIVALARPVWGIEAEIVETEGVAILILIDVSRSMDAQDLLPSRLERAKLELTSFAQEMEGNDIGIILFAGEPFVYMPMTYDVNSTITFLSGITTNVITRQGTDTAQALDMAITVLDRYIAAQSIIIVVSDGENHEDDPLPVAEQAAERDIVIHALGYGTEDGEIIPIYDNEGNIAEYQVDESNNIVTSRLFEDSLQKITEITGGVYQQAGDDGTAINTILESIHDLESDSLGDRAITRHVERFGIFILLTLLALSLEIWLQETRGEIS